MPVAALVGIAVQRGAGVVFAVLLTACSEPVSQLKRDYVGDWQGPRMTLSIRADGTVEYERIKEGGNVSIKGPLKEFRGDDFVVGVSFLTTTFEVSEPPHEVDGQWQMVVDGVRLTRISPGGSGPLRPASLAVAGATTP
jgi:hypothetical protein